jgi:phosphoadenosine phosphosulfate reductase
MTYLQKIKEAKRLIKKQLEEHPGKCIVGCSFGKDSMVLYHLCRSVKKDIPVFVVMTPFKPKETLKYKDKMIKRYNMNAVVYCREERTDTPEWWKSNPDECCKYYKVDMTEKALENYDCWFAGLRRSESKSRAELEYVVKPDRFGKTKVNPILDFTERDIWRYLALNRIPANPLYKKGYRSLGCLPCSSKEKDENEEERAGRWKGTAKVCGECGIHSVPK